MFAFLYEWRSDFRSKFPFLIWLVLSVVIALAGPFGTYRLLTLFERLSFWAVIVALAVFVGTATRAFVFSVFKLRDFRRGSVLIALILALMFPGLVQIVIAILNPPLQLMVPSAFEVGVFTFLCSLSVGAYRHATGQLGGAPEPVSTELRSEAAVPDQNSLAATAKPRLLSRLPAEAASDIMSMTVRDHYVDVRTSSGIHALLMRLSDAIGETDSVEGAQIHRSHWVAWSAVSGVEVKGQKMVVVLTDGARLPVSKTYRPLVEARGIGQA